jgi:hypothetical protein
MDQPMKKLALGLLLSFGGLSAALAQGSNRIDAYGNFIPNMGGTQTIAATTTSASVTLTATDLQNTDLNLFNLGTGLVFCRWGNGAQTAVLTDMPVPVGASRTFSKFPVINPGQGITQAVACITGTGTATVYVTTGVGR